MLISTVVLPESFSESLFADPTYHINMELFLRGIDTNGLILVDTGNRLYQQMCDNVELLKSHKKGKTIHALFEELIKKQRQKIIRFVFVKTADISNPNLQPADVALSVAIECGVGYIITNLANHPKIIADGGVQVLPVTNYSASSLEHERRNYVSELPSLDTMAGGEFDKLISDATRYSRWLRFYDKQIGKGTSLGRFRQGMERILNRWVHSAHFPLADLSVELLTVVDESQHKVHDPSVAFYRVKHDLVDSLHNQFNIPIRLSVRRDPDSKMHARFLQTQSLAILFERGFDILGNNGALNTSFVTIGGNFECHLRTFRQLQEFVPAPKRT